MRQLPESGHRTAVTVRPLWRHSRTLARPKGTIATVHTLCAMKAASWIVAALSVGCAGLLLFWGVWLLATNDLQGGRDMVGATMIVVAVLCGVLGLVALRRARRSLT